MGKDYENSKIYDKVIFVTRPTNKWSICNSYVAEAGNKNMLDSAITWAGKNNTQHEYENGNFKLSIISEAGGSSQGGKLSFWNCKIYAPDGKEFIIGINSASLCELLQYSDFKHGLCEESIYLGRKQNNVCAFTKDMPSYQDAVNDENLRQTMKASATVKYEPGDILESLTEEKVYLGRVWAHAQLTYSWSEYNIYVYKKPTPLYVYGSKCGDDKLYFISQQKTKSRMTITGHMDISRFSTIDRIANYETQNINGKLKDAMSRYFKLAYSDSEEKPENLMENLKVVKQELISGLEEYNRYSTAWGRRTTSVNIIEVNN